MWVITEFFLTINNFWDLPLMFALGVTSIKYQFSIILGHLEYLLRVRKNVNQSNFKINEKKKKAKFRTEWYD